MPGSGVMRLRLTKRGGGENPLEWGSQKTSANGGATKTGSEPQVPKKKGAFENYDYTGVPQGNESPSRGEHPRVTQK